MSTAEQLPYEDPQELQSEFPPIAVPATEAEAAEWSAYLGRNVPTIEQLDQLNSAAMGMTGDLSRTVAGEEFLRRTDAETWKLDGDREESVRAWSTIRSQADLDAMPQGRAQFEQRLAGIPAEQRDDFLKVRSDFMQATLSLSDQLKAREAAAESAESAESAQEAEIIAIKDHRNTGTKRGSKAGVAKTQAAPKGAASPTDGSNATEAAAAAGDDSGAEEEPAATVQEPEADDAADAELELDGAGEDNRGYRRRAEQRAARGEKVSRKRGGRARNGAESADDGREADEDTAEAEQSAAEQAEQAERGEMARIYIETSELMRSRMKAAKAAREARQQAAESDGDTDEEPSTPAADEPVSEEELRRRRDAMIFGPDGALQQFRDGLKGGSRREAPAGGEDDGSGEVQLTRRERIKAFGRAALDAMKVPFEGLGEPAKNAAKAVILETVGRVGDFFYDVQEVGGREVVVTRKRRVQAALGTVAAVGAGLVFAKLSGGLDFGGSGAARHIGDMPAPGAAGSTNGAEAAVPAAPSGAGSGVEAGLNIRPGERLWTLLQEAGVPKAEIMDKLSNAADQYHQATGLPVSWHGEGTQRWLEVNGQSDTESVYAALKQYL